MADSAADNSGSEVLTALQHQQDQIDRLTAVLESHQQLLEQLAAAGVLQPAVDGER